MRIGTKETIGDRVTPPDKEVWAPNERNTQGRNTQGTNKRMGGRPQTQENKSKLIQARKTLEERDRDLTAAIRRCHIELKRKSLSEIEASKNAVEVAWREHMQASCWYSTYAGWNPFGWKNLEEQPEDARQAW